MLLKVFFAAAIAFAVIDSSFACGDYYKKQNQTQVTTTTTTTTTTTNAPRTKREDQPDIVGMMASGAATAVELVQKGVALEHGFHAKVGEEN